MPVQSPINAEHVGAVVLTHMNIPPGPCPACGHSMAMGQPVCLGCGHDRVSGKNIRMPRERTQLRRIVTGTPIGFLLSTVTAAVLVAMLARGSTAFTRLYIIAAALVALTASFLLLRAVLADPPGFWERLIDAARFSYIFETLLGNRGPAGMQCLVVLASVMIGLSLWLDASLPADQWLIVDAAATASP